jgi:predicted aconitase
VPAERFSAVLGEIRRLGTGKRAERIDSEDVTDEYVDLDARLRVQTRLEEQLLELMKTATTVEAALNVHKELANVRTEVERIQGRKQLLEREVALSTIRVTLAAPPTQSVSVAKIGDSVSQASSDAVVVANGIVVGAIRLTGIFVPVAVLLGLPVLLAVLLVRRRMRRSRIDLSATLPG